ncbi:MAG: nucleoside hydrolase [Bacillota bacterium]
MTVKLLLDTDIGSDIDDAVCLAYLLAQPQCELLGVTTVTGEADKRAMMVSALCKSAGKNIPVYPGAEEPLLIPSYQPRAPQAKALSNWAHDSGFPRGEAVEFLRSTIRKFPGEIILLAIGPLTNIALLFKADAEIPRLLKGLAIMGGVFTNRLAGVGPLEWNIVCDPHAAEIVYQAPVGVHRSVGLDVTCRVTMNARQVKEKFSSGLLRPVLDFAKVWFEERETVTFHDPLAAATIFDDKICGFHRGNVEVELISPKLRGFTGWKADEKGRHEVALEVDAGRFFGHYFTVFD